MDTDKVMQDLSWRFTAPLPEFYQRRIIFWYDEDKEFEDKLDEVILGNAKVIALTSNNAVYHDFVKYKTDGAFWAMVRQSCGFAEKKPDLGRLAIHLLLTAATRTMRQEYLAGLDGFISLTYEK